MSERCDVVVIGAGFAGLAAAVRLADAGLRVIVLDEAPRAGGRATAFTDRDTGERVDNGQHVLFGCYRETYAFLKRVGAETLAPLQPRLRLTMASSGGRLATLRCPRLPPPWHLIAGLLRWRALSLADRVSALGLQSFLRQVRREGAATVAARVDPAATVETWLSAHGQSKGIREWLWHPLAIAALNQSPATAAAAPFIRVIGELFGPRIEDSAIGLPCVPLDELYATPAGRHLEARGGEIRLKTAARVLVDDAFRVAGVRTAGGDLQTSVVVSAVPWHAFGRLWESGVPPPLAEVAADAARMTSSPIVTVNLWFDGPVIDDAFVGLVGGPMHWVFDKSQIFGGRAGHVAAVASGADDLVALDNAAIVSAAVAQLQRTLPRAGSRAILRSIVVREHRASFSVAPGSPPRPAHAAPVAGFYLAGDWTDTGLPATIEGAVTSGHMAADLAILGTGRRARPPGS